MRLKRDEITSYIAKQVEDLDIKITLKNDNRNCNKT